LDRFDSEGLIREVLFHRGLNIVRTPANAPAQAGEPAAEIGNRQNPEPHSVGKTLLVRMIRYSMGEECIVTGEENDDLKRACPDGHLIALWWLETNPWLVIRPFHSTDPKDSFCVQGKDWEGVFEQSIERIPFSKFVKQLESVTTQGLPSIESRRGHRPRWLDILGWLTRDCECGYRQANDWRFPGLYEKKGTDLRENSLILQWLCGLMGQDEAEQRTKHWHLLSQHQQSVQKAESSERQLKHLLESISEELKKPEPDHTTFELQDPTKLFQYQAKPRNILDSLNAIGNDETQKARAEVQRHERIIEEVNQKLVTARATYNKKAGELSEVTGTIRRRELGGKHGEHISRCLELDPKGQCKLKTEFDNDSEIAKCLTKLSTDGDLIERKTLLEQETKSLGNEVKALEQKAENLDAEVTTARNSQLEQVEKLGKSIGKWERLLDEAIKLDEAQSQLSAASKSATELDEEMKQSNQMMESIRQLQSEQARSKQFTRYYVELLCQIFGSEATGTIHVSGNGLDPKPDKALMPRGRARSAMASVIAFDLGAVLASMCGVGNHPRFLIHDSPREGEMIMTFFRRIFQAAIWMQSLAISEPAFQYIVTTADAPPEYAVSDASPTCLVLSGTDRLLKRRY
jgi:uncharacterized coiled-coil DUF342 family protein